MEENKKEGRETVWLLLKPRDGVNTVSDFENPFKNLLLYSHNFIDFQCRIHLVGLIVEREKGVNTNVIMAQIEPKSAFVSSKHVNKILPSLSA